MKHPSTVMASLLSGALLLSACGAEAPELIGDRALVVNAPLYRADKVFYIQPEADRRHATLIEPFALTRSDDVVLNGDPVTIVVNKVYLPDSLTDAKPRVGDAFTRKPSRDIAVLLDVGLKQGTDEQFIAVWYERGVLPGTPLSFENLPVFSQDAWNSDVPPYFRVRVVDVTTERDARTREFLTLASGVATGLSAFVATPAAGLAVSVGARA